MRRILLGFVILLSIGLFVACGSQSDTSNVPSTAPAGNELVIQASNFKFGTPEYRIKSGEPITITLENKQGIHGLSIPDLDIQLDGKNKSVTFTPDKPGTYNMVCSIMCGSGHAQMKSVLIVE